MKKSKCAVLLSSIVLATGVLCGGIVGQSSGFLSELIAENTEIGTAKASYVLNISKDLKNIPTMDGEYVVRTNSGAPITFNTTGLMDGGFKLAKYGSFSNDYVADVIGYNRLSGLKNVLINFEGDLQVSLGTDVNGVVSYLEPVKLSSGVDYPVEFLAQYVKITALKDTVINNLSLSYSCQNKGIFYKMPTPVDCICQPNELNPDELQAVNIELYSNKPTILPSTDIDGQPITRLGSESIHPAYDETYRYEIFMPKCYTSVDQTAFDDLLGTLDYYQSQYPEEEIKLYIQFEGSEEYVQAHNLITNELNTKSYFSMKFNCSFSGYGEKHYVNDSNLLMREIFNEVNRPGFEVVGYQGNDTFAEIPECEVLDGKDMPIYNIDNLYLGRKTLKVVDLPNSFDFTFNGTSSEDPIVYLNINQRTSKNECRSNKMVFNYANEYTTTSDGSIYALYKNSSYERVAALCSGSSTLKTLNVPDEVTIGNSSYKVVTVTQNAMRNGSLESVTLGNNVTTLENGAFDNNNISNFTFNNKLETIKEYALDRNNLTEVTLPNCVRRLERCCLPACVTKLTLNDGLKTICAESFANITNLKEVYIPLSVTEMGQFVFKPSNGMVIKVAASSKPDGWHNDWIFPTGVEYEVLYNQTR